MIFETNRSTLSLAREGLVAIRDGQGTRIVCHTGSLWITQECDVRDVVITGGESFTLSHPGLTLVTALGASELTVTEPGDHAKRWPRRPLAGPAGEPAAFA